MSHSTKVGEIVVLRAIPPRAGEESIASQRYETVTPYYTTEGDVKDPRIAGRFIEVTINRNFQVSAETSLVVTELD